MSSSTRARVSRENRRQAQFAKFRLVQLNLIPLVDTLVSIVFFALTTAVVGDLVPVLRGVTLPDSRVGTPALQQITLGVGSAPAEITFNGRTLMTVQQAAAARSSDPRQPLLVPALYDALKSKADSIRQQTNVGADQSVDAPLAVQGDRTMRYDLLQRILETARLAGFKNLSLQVRRAEVPVQGASASTTT